MDRAYRRAKDLVQQNIEVLHKCADLLMEREQIDGEDLQVGGGSGRGAGVGRAGPRLHGEEDSVSRAWVCLNGGAKRREALPDAKAAAGPRGWHGAMVAGRGAAQLDAWPADACPAAPLGLLWVGCWAGKHPSHTCTLTPSPPPASSAAGTAGGGAGGAVPQVG